MWGEPAAIGTIFEGAAFDVVLDNNGKDLDTVRSVSSMLEYPFFNLCSLFLYVHTLSGSDRDFERPVRNLK